MRFMIFEEGSVNADAFIEFLKRRMVVALSSPSVFAGQKSERVGMEAR